MWITLNHFAMRAYKMFIYLLTLFAISTEIFCLLCVCVVCISGCLCLWILYTLTAGIFTQSHTHTHIVIQSYSQSVSQSVGESQSISASISHSLATEKHFHAPFVARPCCRRCCCCCAPLCPFALALLLLLSLISGCMICWQWPETTTTTTVEEETEVHRQLKYFFVARWQHFNK